MLGAAGALVCLAAGTAAGMSLREKRYARFRLLETELELLARLRLMLIEERLGLCELLRECAAAEAGDALAAERFTAAAQALEKDPLLGLAAAYGQACGRVKAGYEGAEEKEVMAALFSQLGTGTAAMREQAVASSMRRLRPLLDAARTKAEAGGRLCMQLGLLLGLMAGIALW